MIFFTESNRDTYSTHVGDSIVPWEAMVSVQADCHELEVCYAILGRKEIRGIRVVTFVEQDAKTIAANWRYSRRILEDIYPDLKNRG